MTGPSGGDRLGSAVRRSLPVEQIANLILRLSLSAGDCAGSEESTVHAGHLPGCGGLTD